MMQQALSNHTSLPCVQHIRAQYLDVAAVHLVASRNRPYSCRIELLSTRVLRNGGMLIVLVVRAVLCRQVELGAAALVSVHTRSMYTLLLPAGRALLEFLQHAAASAPIRMCAAVSYCYGVRQACCNGNSNLQQWLLWLCSSWRWRQVGVLLPQTLPESAYGTWNRPIYMGTVAIINDDGNSVGQG